MSERERDFRASAELHLRYLRKCRTEADEIEYLAAVLAIMESGGAVRAVEEMAATFNVKLDRLQAVDGETAPRAQEQTKC